MFQRRLDFAPEAQADLAHVEAWLRQPGAGPAAERRIARLGNAIRGLLTLPCAWKRDSATGVRTLITTGHRVIYRLDPDTGSNQTAGNIYLLRVFGPGQLK